MQTIILTTIYMSAEKYFVLKTVKILILLIKYHERLEKKVYYLAFDVFLVFKTFINGYC